MLKAYQTAPDITRERMHIEALEGILDDVGLILLDAEAVGGEVLPFLPLDSLNGAGSTTQNRPARQPSLRSPSVETAPLEVQPEEQVEEGN